MFEVVTHELVLGNLGDVQRIEDIPGTPIDLLIMAIGYEDRTLGLLEYVADNPLEIQRIFAFQHASSLPENLKHVDRLGELSDKLHASLSCFDSVAELLASLPVAGFGIVGRPLRIGLDLSAMSGNVIMEAVGALAQLPHTVTVFYCEAGAYEPSREAFDSGSATFADSGSLGHEEGVSSVNVAAELCGQRDNQLRDHVVVFPGYTRERARAAISYVNPVLQHNPAGNVHWLFGAPPPPNDWREVASRLVHGEQGEISSESISTFEYKQVIGRLVAIFEEFREEANLTIAFMGGKLQALAVSIFASANRSVRVVTASPSTYRPESYTSGLGPIWVVRLGSLSEAVDSIRKIGTIRIED